LRCATFFLSVEIVIGECEVHQIGQGADITRDKTCELVMRNGQVLNVLKPIEVPRQHANEVVVAYVKHRNFFEFSNFFWQATGEVVVDHNKLGE